jgi:hypothetical protein
LRRFFFFFELFYRSRVDRKYSPVLPEVISEDLPIGLIDGFPE